MSDRVPLEQAISKEKESESVPVSEGSLSAEKDLKGINAMEDLGDLSLMLGFDDRFDTMGKEVEDIYGWAKETTGLQGGPEVLMLIKSVINDTGMTA